MTGELILACDLGGTRLRTAIVASDGSVLHKRVISTPADNPQALARTMEEVRKEAGYQVAGAVVGVPGPVDYANGWPVRLPNLPRWEGHVSSDKLSSTLGLRVLLANDADLAVLGEHGYGTGRGHRDVLYVTSSTGVGAGVILNDKLVRGMLSLAEAGHTIIDWSTGDTLESLGSGTALSRIAEKDATQVTRSALSGDRDAQRHLTLVSRALAVGIFNLAHCFSPQIIVIGGGMSNAGRLLLDPIREMLSKCGVGCPVSKASVVKAMGGDDVGLKGAASYWNQVNEMSYQ